MPTYFLDNNLVLQVSDCRKLLFLTGGKQQIEGEILPPRPVVKNMERTLCKSCWHSDTSIKIFCNY